MQWVKGSSVAASVARIQSLAGELPCAVCAAIKKKKKSSEEAYVGRALSEGPVTAILLKTTRTEFVHVLTYSRSLLAFWPSPLAGGGGGSLLGHGISEHPPPQSSQPPLKHFLPSGHFLTSLGEKVDKHTFLQTLGSLKVTHSPGVQNNRPRPDLKGP